MDSGSDNQLKGVWGSSSSNVFAVGMRGVILHYTATPTATTNAATNVANTTNATIDPEKRETTVEFEYGPTLTYGKTITASQSPLSGDFRSYASASVTGLLPGTIYHFRVKATNSAGTSYGYDKVFTATGTTAKQPTVSTSAATEITDARVKLNGVVNPNGAETTYWFQYGTPTGYGAVTTSAGAGSGTGDIAVYTNLSGLNPGATYHYRIVGQNSVGTVYGSDRSFTTNKSSKAIIVAGSGPYPGNNLWPATRMNANYAFKSIVTQGYAKDTIYYLSPETSCDVGRGREAGRG